MVDLGACRMHVRESGGGFPVVLGHSLTFDGGSWDAQRAALDDRYRVLAVDQRGHGQTEWEPGEVTLEEMADDLARLLDALNIERVAYVGLSIGGMIGVRFALRHPDRVVALGLLNTTAEAEEPMRRDFYHGVNERSRGKTGDDSTASLVLGLMFSESFRESHPHVVKPFYERLLEPTDPEGLYFVAKGMMWREDLLPATAEIRVPTLVVTSKGDMAVEAKHGHALVETIPDARLVELEGCGHMTPVERADDVSRELGAFLDDALSAS